MTTKPAAVPVELYLLRIFQRQVLLQCRFVLLAANDVNAALGSLQREQKVDTAPVFYGVTNLLNAAANISKVLWGPGGKRAAQRQRLRDSLGVTDESPLQEVLMRNNFEHFDDRIDHWWAHSVRQNHADLMIGPRSMISGMEPIDMFRQFDPSSGDVVFWGQEFNLLAIVEEVKRILPAVQAECEKPHWEP